jgi:hypothetical protein
MMFALLTSFLLVSSAFSTPITSLPHKGTTATTTLTVDSTALWNPAAQNYYKAGVTLHFSADPQAVWYDVNKKIETTADGYANIGVTMRYNVSNDNIMTMVCCMNNQMNNCANVGSNGELLVTEAGFVSCFANDNPMTYGNNFGSIDTKIAVV